MVVIFSIMALIAAISIYDYMASRKWQQITSDERNEIVFATRNREYGAYQMRKNYNFQLMLIVGAMVFAIGSAYGIYRIVKEASLEEVPPPPDVMAQLTMDAPKIDEPLDPPVEQEVPQMEKTVQFLPPVVTDDEEPDEVPPQTQVEETKAGKEDQEGEGDGLGAIPQEKEKEEVVEKKEDNTVHLYVEESAEFPGGMGALKQYLADNIKYPQTALELGVEGKCYLQFVVSASGNISNVEVKRGVPDCPECDKEAVRVVKNMPHWKPGKNGGKAVHSVFNLPVTFKIQ